MMDEMTKITFDDLQKANATIKTMKISRWDKKQNKEISKEYAEVNQRIKAFRMVYPTGSITTDIISLENGLCIMRARVGYFTTDGRQYVLGEGTAYEKENASNINQTSYIENCETSAVGRALGMAGFGIDTSVASAEEVANAIEQQKKLQGEQELLTEAQEVAVKTIDDAKVAALMSALKDGGVPVEKVLKLYKVETLNDLTFAKWKNALDHIEDLKKV